MLHGLNVLLKAAGPAAAATAAANCRLPGRLSDGVDDGQQRVQGAQVGGLDLRGHGDVALRRRDEREQLGFHLVQGCGRRVRRGLGPGGYRLDGSVRVVQAAGKAFAQELRNLFPLR